MYKVELQIKYYESMREILFLRKSGTELNLEGRKEQMVGYGGMEKSRTAEFSNLQSQINRNILEFPLLRTSSNSLILTSVET